MPRGPNLKTTIVSYTLCFVPLDCLIWAKINTVCYKTQVRRSILASLPNKMSNHSIRFVFAKMKTEVSQPAVTNRCCKDLHGTHTPPPAFTSCFQGFNSECRDTGQLKHHVPLINIVKPGKRGKAKRLRR